MYSTHNEGKWTYVVSGVNVKEIIIELTYFVISDLS